MSRSELLFVYGTLQRGHVAHHLIRSLGRYLEQARVTGRLYDVGGYPGLVLDAEGGEVRGELYRLARPGRAFRILDAYEGCRPPGAGEGEYRRVRCCVVTARGPLSDVWVYEYARPVAGLPWLADGVYLRPKAHRRVREGLGRSEKFRPSPGTGMCRQNRSCQAIDFVASRKPRLRRSAL